MRLSMRYENCYVCFVFLSSLDLILTWWILKAGGCEVNPVADWIISDYGRFGLLTFKFGLVIFVILLCEFIGQHKDGLGRFVARLAVGLTSVPVIIGLYVLRTLAWQPPN